MAIEPLRELDESTLKVLKRIVNTTALPDLKVVESLVQEVADTNKDSSQQSLELATKRALEIARELVLDPAVTNTEAWVWMKPIISAEFADLSPSMLETVDLSQPDSKVGPGDLVNTFFSNRRDLFKAINNLSDQGPSKSQLKEFKKHEDRYKKWIGRIPGNYPQPVIAKAAPLTRYIDSYFKAEDLVR